MSVQVILQIDHRGVGGATLTLQEPAHVHGEGPYGPYGPAGNCRELLVQWKNRQPLLITAPDPWPLSGNEFHLYPFWKSPVGRETGDSPIAMGRRESDPICRLCVDPLRDVWEVQLLTGLLTFGDPAGRVVFRYSLTGGPWSGWTALPSHAVPGQSAFDVGAETVTQRIQQVLPGALVVHRSILLPLETGYRVAFATAVTYLDERPPLRMQWAGDAAAFH